MRWMIATVMAFWALSVSAQDMAGGRMTVSGTGVVDSVPDMAMITLGVTAEARSAARALAETSDATAAVLALLAKAGVAPTDMQTRDLSLSPLWQNRNSSSSQPPSIAGYQASNTVMVRVRALETLGEILDDVVENGANQFHGLSFGLQNPGPAQDDARDAAVADAMRKAARYAAAAGLQLGAVLEFGESGSGSPQPVMMERMAMSAPVPVAGGEVSTRAQVSMVFAITGP